MASSPTAPRTWLITGVSSGIGLKLAQAALARGDTVWGSVRQPAQQTTFQGLAPGRAFAVVMDVTSPAQIRAGVARVLARGPLDVLVNNAGVGMVGAVEETGLDEARTVMETNFFGLLQVTQAVLPALRKQRRGHIVNVSSGVGLVAMPGMAVYSASKHAVEGLSEALAGEVGTFGIHVSLVEPGAVLTGFTGPGMIEAARRLPDYAHVSGHGRAGLVKYYEHQAASPDAVAQAILALVDEPKPPLRRVVGQDVQAMLRERQAAWQAQL
jgi:NAD(P)-dependent dehydrogenase (short-subunit alcohol dehydrogenase family)